MKLLIVTGIKECKEDIFGIFREARIEVFSISEITGFRNGNIPDPVNSWFGSGGDAFDSIMIFSFTQSEKAESVLKLIGEFNKTKEAKFPVRGFMMPVEKYVN